MNELLRKPSVKAAVIVAHPDDETLWCGGLILSCPEWRWTIVTLCRASDPDRAPCFHSVLHALHARGAMADLDDSPDQVPLRAIRESLCIADDQIFILTVGGDAASKGAQEVMQALVIIDQKAPDWKYVCKVWPQPRSTEQNLRDMQLASQLGIDKNVTYASSVVSRNFMPYLLSACDIYAAPSRLGGGSV